jgi:hypothetical protein
LASSIALVEGATIQHTEFIKMLAEAKKKSPLGELEDLEHWREKTLKGGSTFKSTGTTDSTAVYGAPATHKKGHQRRRVEP